jgi:hypothetical protein
VHPGAVTLVALAGLAVVVGVAVVAALQLRGRPPAQGTADIPPPRAEAAGGATRAASTATQPSA